MRYVCGVTYILLAVCLACPPAYCQSFEKLKVVKLSAADHSAVVKGKDGKLKAVSTGQSLMPYGRITAIEKDCIVFEKNGPQGKVLHIIRIEAGGQKIQKITQTPGREDGLKRPVRELPGKK